MLARSRAKKVVAKVFEEEEALAQVLSPGSRGRTGQGRAGGGPWRRRRQDRRRLRAGSPSGRRSRPRGGGVHSGGRRHPRPDAAAGLRPSRIGRGKGAGPGLVSHGPVPVLAGLPGGQDGGGLGASVGAPQFHHQDGGRGPELWPFAAPVWRVPGQIPPLGLGPAGLSEGVGQGLGLGQPWSRPRCWPGCRASALAGPALLASGAQPWPAPRSDRGGRR